MATMKIPLREGDKVVLTGLPSICSPSQTWPLWGSKYECTGIVEDTHNAVYVNWNNGYHCICGMGYLSLYCNHLPHNSEKKIDPNRSFRRKKGHL